MSELTSYTKSVIQCDRTIESRWINRVFTPNVSDTTSNSTKSNSTKSNSTAANDDGYSCYADRYDTMMCLSTGRRKRMGTILQQDQMVVSSSGKLTVVYNTTADRIFFNKNNVAVAITCNGIDDNISRSIFRPSNGGYIVLCCGVFETPNLLYRSLSRHNDHGM